MAMFYITNGEVISKVPMAAFQSQFKNLGFKLVDENEEVTVSEPVEAKQETKEEVVEEQAA